MFTTSWVDHSWGGWDREFPEKPAVGYWQNPESRDESNWVGVYDPQVLPSEVVRNKERVLLEICQREKTAGNQVWVFVQMTKRRDVRGRLVELLSSAGITAGTLPDSVEPEKRLAWLDANASKFDVLVSHPQPVQTGIDLFSRGAGHNFNALVFYQVGTKAFVAKQASRRSWRIGQPKPCRVYYLYYQGTAQHRSVALMAAKFRAMDQIGGQFSEDGLVAMAGGDDGANTLARDLSKQIDDSALLRHFGRSRPASTIQPEPPASLPAMPIFNSPGTEVATETFGPPGEWEEFDFDCGDDILDLMEALETI